jgi:Zn-finger nucleic acid-binding protein
VTSVPILSRPAQAATAQSELACPRCLVAMHEGRAAGVVLRGCGVCGGIWMDNDSAEKALSASLSPAKALAARATANALTDVPTAAPIACPVCSRQLFRTLDPLARVALDLCSEHGTWFDRYELGVVLAARDIRPAAVLPAPRSVQRSVPGQYHGEIPDFRAGANLDWEAASLVAGAAITLLSVALGGASGPDRD